MKYGQVSIDPEVMSGTPVFAGTRVPVQTLFDYIEGGDDLSAFLNDFPSVTKEAAIAVLQMAKKTVTSEKLLNEILLDESLPIKLKADFGPEHEVYTVRDKGWLGQKNGALLQLIVENGFELFVTADRNLRISRIWTGCL